MTAETWQCQAPACSAQIDLRYVMCRRHWYMVPLDVRAVIVATRIDGPIYEYRAALSRARDAVGRKEAHR